MKKREHIFFARLLREEGYALECILRGIEVWRRNNICRCIIIEQIEQTAQSIGLFCKYKEPL